MTNHPKQGGIASFLSAMGMLALAGRVAAVPDGTSSVLTEASVRVQLRRGPPRPCDPFVPQRSTRICARERALCLRTEAHLQRHTPWPPQRPLAPSDPAEAIAAYVVPTCRRVRLPCSFLCGAVDLRLGLGLDDAKVASVVQRLRAEASLMATWTSRLHDSS